MRACPLAVMQQNIPSSGFFLKGLFNRPCCFADHAIMFGESQETSVIAPLKMRSPENNFNVLVAGFSQYNPAEGLLLAGINQSIFSARAVKATVNLFIFFNHLFFNYFY
jgi:hypothetical protein